MPELAQAYGELTDQECGCRDGPSCSLGTHHVRSGDSFPMMRPNFSV